ncbi:response regulator transcription factor [Paenibacillus physcomitrellae]|uniref:DNA-binding response regulator n=1 Tax=Paenibacillus physcomitrellae TaxID=1619311 RepID=A0ABQ1FX24_9BACL|nr:response regulator transcription factor [Paenibacillus physcomitrellae]GGA32057.1 DNA-binding response regulator [Paenibacillus physcomitrellae]
MNRILLIEDNEQLQKYIFDYLGAYGFEAYRLENYDAVLETVEESRPRLILLDITLPKFDGFYYLRLIRKKYNTPVIIISALNEEGEQIRGMELGADDYVTKPFSIGVLLAKINAVLRRAEGQSVSSLGVGGLSVSEDTMNLHYRGRTSELTKNEYKVLRLLLKNAGQIVTREQILEELWDDAGFVDDNTLTVNMSRVKKKLAELGLENIIATRRSVGYVLDPAGL